VIVFPAHCEISRLRVAGSFGSRRKSE
jgi:hypothetical protein